MYKLNIPIDNTFLINESEHCGSDQGNCCAWLQVYSSRCGLLDKHLVRDGEHCLRANQCMEWHGKGEKVKEEGTLSNNDLVYLQHLVECAIKREAEVGNIVKESSCVELRKKLVKLASSNRK